MSTPTVAARRKPGPKPKGPVYVALKKFSVNGREVLPGDRVPEANDWLRTDAWVRARWIKLEAS